MKYYFVILFLLSSLLYPQDIYNHPEIEWQTIETEHFKIHFYSDTEILAREAAGIMEYVYPKITELYQFEPNDKTHLTITDTEDVANGVAYYYDNKMLIWASPLDIALRGSHKWLENVLTHEFTHIVSIQKAMKAGRTFPGAYLQWIGYEEETHKNVLYGYPNTVISYPIPGTTVPPWLAEGTAQFMYQDADWDNWDSHRDMILRDCALHDNLQSFAEMNTFGKCGIGNELVYNGGYVFVKYIADNYGTKILGEMMNKLSNPIKSSINKVIKDIIGIDGEELYTRFLKEITEKYRDKIEFINANEDNITILEESGTTNLYPRWSADGKKIAYISNKANDYFNQTDLYIYNVETKEDKRICVNIPDGATWGAGDSIIYYTKKPKMRDSKGYRYFDIFSYSLNSSKENQLTSVARATSPVYINELNSIAYIAMDKGIQSIFLYSINDNKTTKIADFEDRRILHNLYYDKISKRILFDYTIHHFRNIATLSLDKFECNDLIALSKVDERDICVTPNGKILFSNDENGIFNLAIMDSSTTSHLTNVSGGAFMPDINCHDQIVFSLYKDGRYNIAILDTIEIVELVEYYQKKENYHKPINNISNSNAKKYHDNFAPMFIIPRLMIDYGTFKPGLYFYSSEILDKLSLSGAAAVNFDKDIDFSFNLTYRKLYPTVYTDFMYSTRNTLDKTKYSVYEIDDQLKFRFILMQLGVKLPLYGIQPLDIYARWHRYRAYIKENIEVADVNSGYSYDYFRGISTGIRYGIDNVEMTVDRNINPSKGFRMFADISYQLNDFIDGLNLSDSGTLVEDFAPNNYLTVNVNGSYFINVFPAKRWTLGITAKSGWLSNKDVDSFFNYFGGGLDGIQGYSYYSFEGTNSIFSEIALRIPIFRLHHIPFGWTIWQNATVGVEYQFGDTWSDEFNLKQSVGLQLRINGFSFYNYPTAIGFEVHRGLTKFEVETDDETTIRYGGENRFYITMLFGF